MILIDSKQGFQEALVRQVNDLSELFGSGWAWVRASAPSILGIY